ncbi:MAG: hypothetical protein FJ299_05475 [Planctomycetes bacterium]|nr:hypothetical protein [Planctomycetota bacterium]
MLSTFCLFASSLVAASAPLGEREWIPGRIAYKLRAGADGAQVSGLGDPASHRALFLPPKLDDQVGLARWFTCEVAAGTEDAAVAHLRAAPEIEYAERVNTGLALAGTPPQPPSDPLYSTQWPLGQGNDVDMDVLEAWTLRGTYEADGLLVGVIDTGYDTQFSGPEFANVIWTNPNELANGLDDDGNGLIDDLNGWDFVNNDSVSYSDHPHGTQTSSVIAARSDNANLIAGVASGVKILAPKTFNAGGGYPCCGPWAGALSAAVAIEYCVDAGCVILNNSWTNATSPFQAQQDAVQYALDNGVHVVFAAGNANTTTAWPPMTEGVIAVAAIDSNGNRSSWGFGQASNYGAWVDLSAGGTDVPVVTTGGNSTLSSGTSFASPNVVGVAALALSEAPKLSTDDLLDLLKESAVSVDALNPGFAGQLGSGHVNALFALRSLKPVQDLGGAFGGPKLPVLNAWGSFGVGKQFSLSLSRARASSFGAFVVGFSAANLPLFGGVLVPSAEFVLPLVTNAKGAAKQVVVFTSQLPSGTQLRAQVGVVDAAAPQGVALTNALLLSVP